MTSKLSQRVFSTLYIRREKPKDTHLQGLHMHASNCLPGLRNKPSRPLPGHQAPLSKLASTVAPRLPLQCSDYRERPSCWRAPSKMVEHSSAPGISGQLHPWRLPSPRLWERSGEPQAKQRRLLCQGRMTYESTISYQTARLWAHIQSKPP